MRAPVAHHIKLKVLTRYPIFPLMLRRSSYYFYPREPYVLISILVFNREACCHDMTAPSSYKK